VRRAAQSCRFARRLRKPADGKPFLISNCLPDKIKNGYVIWTWADFLIFIGTGGGVIALR